MKDYYYPIDVDWKTEEIIEVVKLYELVEKAYETQVKAEQFLTQYRKFQTIVGGKMHEKRIDREFNEASGYSIYEVFKKAQEGGNISLQRR